VHLLVCDNKWIFKMYGAMIKIDSCYVAVTLHYFCSLKHGLLVKLQTWFAYKSLVPLSIRAGFLIPSMTLTIFQPIIAATLLSVFITIFTGSCTQITSVALYWQILSYNWYFFSSLACAIHLKAQRTGQYLQFFLKELLYIWGICENS
jgi:hypothetical protein